MPEAKSAGFTLVEMLVALFLLSLVGLTLAHFQAFTVGATTALTGREAASLAADNAAIDLLLFPGAKSGSSENGGVHYQWSATFAPGPAPGLTSVHLSLHPEEKPGLEVRRAFLRPEPKTGVRP